jgi:hypothetical protein
MAKTKHDLQGKTFGRLRVISRAENSVKNEARWNCVCECGSMYVAVAGHLVRGALTSCGCRQRLTRLSHGLAKHPLYRIWVNMLARCYNPKEESFQYYGGRGVTVCERWRESLQNFIDDMPERPRGWTIERIDTNGNYCPENCRWATPLEQTRNRRITIFATIGNERRSVGEWCKILGQPYSRIIKRIECYGMSPETALLTPLRGKPRE